MILVDSEFKRELKKADTFIVRFRYEHVTLELVTKADSSKVWEQEKRVIFSYKNKHTRMKEAREGFFMVDYIKHNTCNVLNLILKPGMYLKLDYYCNGSTYLDKNGLFNDELIASIYNKNKVCICERIVIDHCICEDNSGRALKF